MPDFVLLHPQRGIIILEVKDWSRDGPDVRSLRSAIATAQVRVEEVSQLYCPDLGYRYRGRVSHRFVFPNLSQKALRMSCAKLPSWTPANFITADDFGQDLAERLESALPTSAKAEVVEAVSDLRRWFTEPEFSKAQRRPLSLDKKQLRLVREDPARRVIHGPAGSGKSQVLAARASELARDGKRVLVLSYNITLLNYLRDLAVRWPDPSLPSRDIRENVVWLNFHQWCKRCCKSSPFQDEYSELWEDPNREAVLETQVANLLIRVLEAGHEESGAYDAILVDEAQDFARSWLDALPAALRHDGQLWVAVDLTQDIYRRGETWPKGLFKGLGFRQPVRLSGSHRLHPIVAKKAAFFAQEYLSHTYVENPDQPEELALDLETKPPALRWIQVRPDTDTAEMFFQELWRQLPKVDDPAIAELIFLCSTHELGLAVTEKLESAGVHVRHTFAPEGETPRHQKMAFFKGDARVKGTTVHSFKGWETRLLVLHVGKGKGEETRRSVYTGLTRLLKCPSGSALTVVCEDTTFQRFGKQWPDFQIV